MTINEILLTIYFECPEIENFTEFALWIYTHNDE